MQRPVIDVDDRRKIEGAGQLHGEPQRIGGRRRPVVADQDVEGVGGSEFLNEICRVVRVLAGRERRGDARMREIRGDQPLQFVDELMDALRRKVELEQFDRDEPIAVWFVRAEDGSESPGADLVENAEWTEGVRGAGIRSFRVQ